MRVDRIIPSELQPAPGDGASVSHPGHRHAPWRLSRRRFLQAAGGATAVGALGRSALLTGVARAAGPPGIGQALPIPTTVEFFPGVESHVLAPPFLFGPDSDPATVYNFQGAAGLAYISGTVDRTDRATGETRTLPYQFNDMRFMKGVFRGRDGLERNATFSFIWIDVYDPSSGGAQIHDFNPGITQTGVFWTTVVSADAVQVGAATASASIQVSDLAQKDFIDFENAILGGTPAVPGRVSFRVEWTAQGDAQTFDNPDQRYRALVRGAMAQMEWSARTVDFDFRSAPLETSTTEFAQLGLESNGSYY